MDVGADFSRTLVQNQALAVIKNNFDCSLQAVHEYQAR